MSTNTTDHSNAVQASRSRRRSRSGPTGVTLDQVVATALRQVQDSGLETLSIRRVAADLGISTMTIYRYVDSKDDLIDEMLALALSRMEIPYSSAPDWKHRVVDTMVAWRLLLLEHPSIVQLLVDRRVPAGSEGLGRLAEHVLASLEDGGIEGRDAGRAFWQIFSLTFGHVVFERSRRDITEQDQSDAAEAMSATAKGRGFDRVHRLADELTTISARGTLEDSLLALLDGIQPR